MKKTVLTILVAALCAQVKAQAVSDTVSVGASYANQVWYSLQNDNQGEAAKNNWDLAFDVTGFGSTIMINSITGTTLWNYPTADTAGWATVDTTGLSSWPTRWNAETSWDAGAMGRYADASDPSDLDWGMYNVTTHIVTGDSLYIIKLSSGAYKKLWIQSLSGSTYTFKYADIDGSNEHTATLNKSGYTNKNFGYYSLQTNAAVDREPVSANWDLFFGQYTTFIPNAYTVTGVLANKGVSVAKCTGLADKATFEDWGSAIFSEDINTIGYNWKTFTGSAYTVVDSTVFFVQTADGAIWKMIFTGFAGSSTGSYMFTKEKLQTATGIDEAGQHAVTAAIYPNPASNQAVTVLYSANGDVIISVFDMAGRLVKAEAAVAMRGLQQYVISAGTLKPGMYIVNVSSGTTAVQQKLIIQ